MHMHPILCFLCHCLCFTCLIVDMLYCKEYHVLRFAYYKCWRGENSKTSFGNGKTVFQLPVTPVHNKPF